MEVIAFISIAILTVVMLRLLRRIVGPQPPNDPQRRTPPWLMTTTAVVVLSATMASWGLTLSCFLVSIDDPVRQQLLTQFGADAQPDRLPWIDTPQRGTSDARAGLLFFLPLSVGCSVVSFLVMKEFR